MTISVKVLKELLAFLPEDARVHGYEGEDTGITVNLPDGDFTWIRARCCTQDDEQPEFYAWVHEHQPSHTPRHMVIDASTGGFSLSEAAQRRWAELSGISLTPSVTAFGTRFEVSPGAHVSKEAIRAITGWGIFAFDPAHHPLRDDPMLIRVVNELGARANGTYADLRIVEIPAWVDVYVDALEDGSEVVRERHRIWRASV